MVGGVIGPAATYERMIKGIVEHWTKEIEKFQKELVRIEKELAGLGYKKPDYKALAKSKDAKVKKLIAARDKAVTALESAKTNLELNVRMVQPPQDVSEADEKTLSKNLKNLFSKKGAKIAQWVSIAVKIEPKYDKKKKTFALKKFEVTLKFSF